MRSALHPLVVHAKGHTPPGPRGTALGLLGALPEVARGRLFELLHHLWRSYGDLSAVRIGPRLMISAVHPEHITQVLVSRRERYDKSSHRARVLLGDGLPASNGESWARQRRLLQPCFVARAMPRFDAPVQAAVAPLIARWERIADAGGEIELADEMTALTLDMSLRSLSDQYLTDRHASLRQAIVDTVEFVAASGQLFRLPLSLPTVRNRRFLAARAEIDQFIRDAISEHRRVRSHTDLLSLILDAQAEDPSGFPDELVRDEAVSLLLGAYDSTARALTWSWACLDLHREARARVHEEIDRLGGRTPGSEDRSATPWTTAFVHEVLRLYPPFWVFPRRCIVDDELGGYAIPSGATVMISPYLTHHHPGLWAEPERFDPERFLGGAGAQRARASAMYFGFGPRTCIGNHLALLEVVAVIGALAQRFELVRVGGPIVPEFGTTLRPRGGLRMQVRRRAA
ncbi:MAG: cytochrome P450 [Nannocystaceae bacterium]